MKQQNGNSSSFGFASLKPYTPPQEYAESRWFGRDEILLGQFHPILKQASHGSGCFWSIAAILEQGSQHLLNHLDIARYGSKLDIHP